MVVVVRYVKYSSTLMLYISHVFATSLVITTLAHVHLDPSNFTSLV